jgi:hypothetical protein
VIPVPANKKALVAFKLAIYGLIPVIGLLLGPLAVAIGLLGWRHYRIFPKDRGIGHAIGAVILGSLELLTNGLGLLFIWIGLNSTVS